MNRGPSRRTPARTRAAGRSAPASAADRGRGEPSHAVWQRAVIFAQRAHRHQTRDDGVTPYASHVLRVALTVRHVFGCDDELALVSAILHDTIEDTPTDFDDIAEQFGPDIAVCVAALTKNMLLPEGEREVEYGRRLGAAPWQARLVKLADVFDNLSDLTHPDAPRPSAERLRKMLAKCAQAINLARADESRPHVARAIAAVESLVAASRRTPA